MGTVFCIRAINHMLATCHSVACFHPSWASSSTSSTDIIDSLEVHSAVSPGACTSFPVPCAPLASFDKHFPFSLCLFRRSLSSCPHVMDTFPFPYLSCRTPLMPTSPPVPRACTGSLCSSRPPWVPPSASQSVLCRPSRARWSKRLGQLLRSLNTKCRQAGASR